MPVLKIHIDQRFDDAVRERGQTLIETLSAVLVGGLAADPAKCQILLLPGAMVSPAYPLYVDLQFRANSRRGSAQIDATLARIAGILEAQFHCAIRLRAFALDESMLFALDHSPEVPQ